MRSFNEISFYDFQNSWQGQIVKEIQLKGKEYILNIDEQEFLNYLYDKFLLQPLTVLKETESFDIPKTDKEKRTDRFYDQTYEVDAYMFTVKYNYTGSSELFRVQPSTWTMTAYDIDVYETTQIVSFKFKIYSQDVQEFNRTKNECFGKAFTNIENVNTNVIDFNRHLRESINTAFEREKSKYLNENNFFAAINLKTNPETNSVFAVPVITKKIIPQLKASGGKQFSSEPTMSNEAYNDVLNLIYESGKSMEKKTALYAGKDEEGLRDQFLFVLETRYEGITATGETFNRSGKTDIILKYAKDGSNLFVAECKFWHGASEFLTAISQLFERYLTWRDSKAALLIFVKNKDFSNVLITIKNEGKKHKLFIKENGNRGETSFSYIFCLPQDLNKYVYFEIMAFHYDK